MIYTILNGNKTYIMVGIIFAAGIAQAFGVQIPSYVDVLLFGGAIATHRMAISQVAQDVKDIQMTVGVVKGITDLTQPAPLVPSSKSP